ncbi:MAG: Hpt domain-containing protein [Bacteroidia bacterium]
MDGEQLYDLAQLEAVAAGSQEFVSKMVDMFIEMTPALVQRIENGLGLEDWAEVQSASHKMKPSIDMMGISSLHDVVRSIEQNAKHQTSLDDIPAQFAKLQSTLQMVIEQLKNR